MGAFQPHPGSFARPLGASPPRAAKTSESLLMTTPALDNRTAINLTGNKGSSRLWLAAVALLMTGCASTAPTYETPALPVSPVYASPAPETGCTGCQ